MLSEEIRPLIFQRSEFMRSILFENIFFENHSKFTTSGKKRWLINYSERNHIWPRNQNVTIKVSGRIP